MASSASLGAASYLSYLLHLPFMTLFHGTGLRELLTSASPVLAEAGFWAFLLSFLALCIGLHYWVERPLCQGLVRLFGLQVAHLRPAASPLRPSV